MQYADHGVLCILPMSNQILSHKNKNTTEMIYKQTRDQDIGVLLPILVFLNSNVHVIF